MKARPRTTPWSPIAAIKRSTVQRARLSLHLVNDGGSKAYCGVGELGAGHLVASLFLVWIVTDFYEFASPGSSTRRTTSSTTRRPSR